MSECAKINPLATRFPLSRTPPKSWPTKPSLRAVMQGVRRTLGVAPKKKDALVRDQLLEVVAAIPNDLRGLRDQRCC